MLNRSHILIVATVLGVTACDGMDAATKQWLDPDKTFASLDQPEVDTVNQTLEKQALEATAKGNYARAAQFYKQLLDSPKSTKEDKKRYKLGIAESTRRNGEAQQALSMYDELLKDDPKNLEVQEGRGIALMQVGKTVEAGRQFAAIMKKDKKRWRTLNALGILFVNKNMIPEAMAYYTAALKASDDNPAILNNVALSQAVDGNYARAFEAFEQAIRVSQTEAQRKQINLNMAMVYGISGDLETARDIAEKYLEGPALDNNLGLYAHLAKDDALAKTYLNMALSGSQTYYERAWNNLDVIEGKKD